MDELTQDAFCYMCKYSCPDLFIIFTTNRKGKDILWELHQLHTPQDLHNSLA